jgi:hypothetical protein
MTLRIIDKVIGDDQADTRESLDSMQELYLERIVTAIETQNEFNLEAILYEKDFLQY